MKKLFSITMIVFWTGTAAIVGAGLVVNEMKSEDTGKQEKSAVIEDFESVGGVDTITKEADVVDSPDGETEYTTEFRTVEKQQYMNPSLVAAHNTKNDCWLIIDGGVYDVGEYIPFHPGGDEEIIPSCGTDSTSGFNARGSKKEPHSAAANAMLKKYLVARIGDPWGTITVTEEVRVPVNGNQEEVVIKDTSPEQSVAKKSVAAPVKSAPLGVANFSTGTSIRTTANVSVRQNPSTSGKKLGVESIGSTGIITSGPTSANGYWWYYIEYNDGVKGWSVQDFMTESNSSDPQTPVASTPTSDTKPTTSGLDATGVATHNTSNDCWLIISGKVYDVTQYIPFHPGGESRIINECGTDATTLFTSNSGNGHNHSSSAHNLLANYLVGNLETTPTTTPDPDAPTCTSFTYSSWGTCQPDGTKTRTVNSSSPADCIGGGPDIIQSCTYTPPAPPPSSGGLTAADVATHDTSNDCWLIISGKVYDVTQYIPFHPGGESRIINECGTDATTLFTSNSGNGHNHSSSAHNLLANYLVGNLETTPTTTPDPDAPTCTSFTYSSWGTCQPDGTKTRTVNSSSPADCIGGGPDIIQSCTYTPPAPPPSSGGLTAADVATHDTSNDCWLIISGKVYDVTQYIPFHPGGESRIINECGTDATTLFTSNSGNGHNHSSSAHNLLANYLVGNLETTPTTTPDPDAPTCTSFTYSSWGVCLSNSTQLRSITTSLPSGCAGGSPITSQSCTYTPPASPDQAYRDAIEAEYPGADITKLSIEDDGRAEFKFTWNGESYEGKMNAAYQITSIE